jgi:hypothetical protein
MTPDLSPIPPRPPNFRSNDLRACATCKWCCYQSKWYRDDESDERFNTFGLNCHQTWYEVVCDAWEAKT